MSALNADYREHRARHYAEKIDSNTRLMANMENSLEKKLQDNTLTEQMYRETTEVIVSLRRIIKRDQVSLAKYV